MNSKVDIKGDVDLVIGQNHGPITINKNYMGAAGQRELIQKRSIAREEDEFQKEYGMLASAPARVALQLLLEENLIKSQVAEAWKRGQLNYEDNNKLSITVKKYQLWVGNFLFGLGALVSLPAFFLNPVLDLAGVPAGAFIADRIMIIVLCLTVSASLVWVSMGFLRPYHAVNRISKHIKKINTRLRKHNAN